MAPKRLRRRRWQSLYLWHRYIGAGAFLLLVLAALTGLALNHTEALGLERRYLSVDWLLDWYGIEAPTPGPSYSVAGHRLTPVGDHVYLNTTPLETPLSGPLAGAIHTNGLTLMATREDIAVLAPGGRLIERLDARTAFGGSIERLGVDASGRAIVGTPDATLRGDQALLRWSRAGGEGITWSKSDPLPAALGRRLAEIERRRVLDLERLMLDLHSGRILGRFGPLLMDAAAVVMLILGITGLTLWFRQAAKHTRTRRPS
jgi:hypothetical protein